MYQSKETQSKALEGPQYRQSRENQLDGVVGLVSQREVRGAGVQVVQLGYGA